jgi:hypothetical protein
MIGFFAFLPTKYRHNQLPASSTQAQSRRKPPSSDGKVRCHPGAFHQQIPLIVTSLVLQPSMVAAEAVDQGRESNDIQTILDALHTLFITLSS